jgi:hypothetical protein
LWHSLLNCHSKVVVAFLILMLMLCAVGQLSIVMIYLLKWASGIWFTRVHRFNCEAILCLRDDSPAMFWVT